LSLPLSEVVGDFELFFSNALRFICFKILERSLETTDFLRRCLERFDLLLFESSDDDDDEH
jgi:hypothetical protein